MYSVAKLLKNPAYSDTFCKISYGLIENCMFEGSTLLIQFTGFCVLRMRKSVCARCLSVMTRRRVSALVTASVLSVGCSASATVCCAVGRQESECEGGNQEEEKFWLFHITCILLFCVAKLRKKDKIDIIPRQAAKVDAEGENLNNCSGVKWTGVGW